MAEWGYMPRIGPVKNPPRSHNRGPVMRWTVVVAPVFPGSDEAWSVLELTTSHGSSRITIRQVIPAGADWEVIKYMAWSMTEEMTTILPSGTLEGDDASE